MDTKDPNLADQPPPATPTTLLTTRYRVGFALALIIGALAYFGYTAFQNATVTFMSVDEVAAQAPTAEDRSVGVSGKLVKDSYIRSPDGLVANFKLQDETEGDHVLQIRYSGEIGQVFFNDHSEIILRGSLGSDGVFDAAHLTVRCPSKYLTEQERADMEGRETGQPEPPPYQPDYFDTKARAGGPSGDLGDAPGSS